MKNPIFLRRRVLSAPRFARGGRAARGLSTRAAILFCAVAAIAGAHPGAARAQVFAQLGPGAVLKKDVRLGAYGLAGEHQVGGLADARFLLTPAMDLGLELGARHFSDTDYGENVVDVALDLRYGLVEESADVPLDASLGAGLGVTSGDHLTILTTAMFAAASKTLTTSAGREVTPYGGLVLTIAHTKLDAPGQDHHFSDPDVDLALRLGLEAALDGDTAITGELQIKEEMTAYLGLSTSF